VSEPRIKQSYAVLFYKRSPQTYFFRSLLAIGNWTPLMIAAPHGSPEMISILLDAGANVKSKDVVVKLLLGAEADLNIKSMTGETALDWAKKFGIGRSSKRCSTRARAKEHHISLRLRQEPGRPARSERPSKRVSGLQLQVLPSLSNSCSLRTRCFPETVCSIARRVRTR
jgi:hypothetical protein